MSCILGVTAFHPDSSACVVVDGVLKAAIAEERLGKRIKHDAGFPYRAIEKVLSISGVDITDVTHIAIARDPRANIRAKIGHSLRHPVDAFPELRKFFKRNNQMMPIPNQIFHHFNKTYNPKTTKFVCVEHHLAHIASAYYVSPFESLTAALSYDGKGDFACTMAARCEGVKIEIIDRVMTPDSLGSFYTTFCQFIGFDGFGEEYKVMGLAPYGEDKFTDVMRQFLRLHKNGWYKLHNISGGTSDNIESGTMDENGHIVMGCNYTKKFIDLMGTPRKRSDALTQREKDIARSCQVRFEEAAIHCVKRLHQFVPTRQLAMAGGCALNGVANARILRDTPFTDVYLQSAASDEGTSLGAAYWCYHNIVGGQNRYHMRHAYWGPKYSPIEIKQAIESASLSFEEFPDDVLFGRIVGLLREGKVIGWYQGRSEWGPRALGNRSILADPTNPNMKDIINAKIKRRESFRPFAPSVLAEKVKEYFEQDVKSPFMMHVVKFKPEWRTKLPAVTHVDGTGRLQSVTRDENPRYYDLIKRFSDVSGVGVLLNTSFNENEPIVDTPQQAINCFLRTDMDAICLNNFLVIK